MDGPGGRPVRPLAEVEPLALAVAAVPVERDLLARGQPIDVLALVVLAHLLEERLGLLAIDHLAAEGPAGRDDLAHLLLDAAEVVVGEGAGGLVEVVVEARVRRRPEGDLGAREQALDRVGHDVRGRVPEDAQTVGIGGADRLDLGALGADEGGVDVVDLPVHLRADHRGILRQQIGEDFAQRHLGCAGLVLEGHERGYVVAITARAKQILRAGRPRDAVARSPAGAVRDARLSGRFREERLGSNQRFLLCQWKMQERRACSGAARTDRG
jgi:hypothetical protein